MTRGLRRDERELWDRLRQTVKPLRRARPGKARAEAEAAAVAGRDSVGAPAAAVRSRATIAPKEPAKIVPPALAPFEEKTRRRLARGSIEIDARIDLHGMRQARAFAALSDFLRRAAAEGARIVLVVTGKGGEGAGRGVLRESVPAWLARDDLRHLVGGFEEAHRRHGGAGALYVRLRRRAAPP